jgi:hypothetical protein
MVACLSPRGAGISWELPDAKFIFSFDDHVAVAADGMLFDNRHPDGVAAYQYLDGDAVIQCVICLDRQS